MSRRRILFCLIGVASLAHAQDSTSTAVDPGRLAALQASFRAATEATEADLTTVAALAAELSTYAEGEALLRSSLLRIKNGSELPVAEELSAKGADFDSFRALIATASRNKGRLERQLSVLAESMVVRCGDQESWHLEWDSRFSALSKDRQRRMLIAVARSGTSLSRMTLDRALELGSEESAHSVDLFFEFNAGALDSTGVVSVGMFASDNSINMHIRAAAGDLLKRCGRRALPALVTAYAAAEAQVADNPELSALTARWHAALVEVNGGVDLGRSSAAWLREWAPGAGIPKAVKPKEIPADQPPPLPFPVEAVLAAVLSAVGLIFFAGREKILWAWVLLFLSGGLCIVIVVRSVEHIRAGEHDALFLAVNALGLGLTLAQGRRVVSVDLRAKVSPEKPSKPAPQAKVAATKVAEPAAHEESDPHDRDGSMRRAFREIGSLLANRETRAPSGEGAASKEGVSS